MINTNLLVYFYKLYTKVMPQLSFYLVYEIVISVFTWG